jgi:hypothetical protein
MHNVKSLIRSRRGTEPMMYEPQESNIESQTLCNPSALNDMGVKLRAAGNTAAAVVVYRRALECGPETPGLLSNLGNALKDLQRFDESIALHRRATQLSPDSVRVAVNLAVALRESGRVDEALAEFSRALRLAPEDASARFDRAQLLLMCGDYRRGWPEFEWRWRLADVKAPKYRQPLWDGTPHKDATILLWPEQGFGDTILCARFIPLVKKRVGRVVLGCQPELVRLFSRLKGIDAVVPYGAPLPRFDMHCPLMSLPRFFLTDLRDIPPPARLSVPGQPPQGLQAAIARAGTRLKVGIVWSGSLTFKANHIRSTSLERFLELTAVPGIQLFSLQKGPRAADLTATGADRMVIDLAPYLNDFADTAAAVSRLDLVIMVDSAVAHLSASLGRPVWNLMRYVPYWLYLRDRCDTPWYPSMTLFRQSRPGDWDGVFGHVVSSLARSVRKTDPQRAAAEPLSHEAPLVPA